MSDGYLSLENTMNKQKAVFFTGEMSFIINKYCYMYTDNNTDKNTDNNTNKNTDKNPDKFRDQLICNFAFHAFN